MNIWKITSFVMTAAFVSSLTLFTMTTAHADPQPKMNAALSLLRLAKDQLQEATADKGGHRVKAIQLTNDAIEETKKGIESDNKN